MQTFRKRRAGLSATVGLSCSLTVQQRCGMTYQLTVLTFPVLTDLNVVSRQKFYPDTLKCIFSRRLRSRYYRLWMLICGFKFLLWHVTTFGPVPFILINK